MGIAYAHGTQSLPPTPTGLFEVKWIWDPTLIVFLALALLYFRGLRSYRKTGRAPVARWQKILFFIGIAVLAIAYLPPVDTLSDELFSAHMVQHLMITSLGVPLLILGAPFLVSVRGLPLWFRRRIFVPGMRSRPLRSLLRFLQRPLIAIALFEATLWFWHIPRFYDLALFNDAIHLLEHACMAFAAMNLWYLFIDPHPLRSPIKPPVRIIFLGFLLTLDMALSAALTYSEEVWYAFERLPVPEWWAWDRLQDQRLGGIIMWVPGGMIWLLAILVTFYAWTRREQAREPEYRLSPARFPS